MDLSPFAQVEACMRRRFGPANAQQDRSHFDYLSSLPARNLDAIKYLYDRLNIIDAKANTLLTVNALSIGLTSFVSAVGIGMHGQRNLAIRWIAMAAVLCAVIGLLGAMTINRLKFDHIHPPRTEDHYLNTFFEVTIARQNLLALARAFTGVGFLLYAVVALYVVYNVT